MLVIVAEGVGLEAAACVAVSSESDGVVTEHARMVRTMTIKAPNFLNAFFNIPLQLAGFAPPMPTGLIVVSSPRLIKGLY